MSDEKELINDLKAFAASINSETEKLKALADQYTQTAARLKKNTVNQPDTLKSIRSNFGDLQEKLEEINNILVAGMESLPMEEAGTTAESERSMERAIGPQSFDQPMGTKEENFADFLSSIGRSVVASQEALDQQSIDYLKRNRDRPYIPPTLFRIPKISASLKLGLKTSSSEQLSVLIASRKNAMDQLNEQSISFEIAAVPPTAELLNTLEQTGPRIDFLLNPTGRQAVFAFLDEKRNELDANDKLIPQLDRILESGNRKQVLIWPLQNNQTFLLLLAGEASSDDVGIWYVDQEGRKIVSVMRIDLKSNFGQDQNPLRAFVQELGLTQATLL